ncbi:MAG: ABC transporter ATP-binding protein/permease [Burkholderiales bacterium]|jgi:ATP-binding cassette subfamily C protein|nr:ABC transporter ATP-binding protein/permease [Burkholderiales bacterium]
MPRRGFTWSSILALLREHRRSLLIAHAVAIGGALASVPVPLLMPLMVDEVLLQKPGPMVEMIDRLTPAAWHGPVLYILAALLLTLLLRLTALVLGVWQAREFVLIAKDVVYRMREQLLLRLSRIALAEYETLGSGTVASHLVKDLDAVDNFIGVSISKFVVAVLSIIGTAVVLLWMHWKLALFILLLNPAVIYFTMVLGKRVKELKKRENSAFELFQQSLTETLDAIHQIRALNRERHYIAQVIDRARGIRTHTAAFSWKSDAAGRLSFLVFLFGFDVFRALAMFMVLFSGLSIGQMMAVFGYLWFMMGPVQEILGIQYAYYGAKAALSRVNKLLRLQEEPEYPHLKNPFRGKRTVSLAVEDVYFSYGDTPVLNGVSLSIAPGEKVALVGASGGGKSTLVQVILGLYTPQSGTVRFDGVPIEEIGLDVVRSHVGTVLQHPALFNETVRMNLTLGRELTDDQLWRALEIAQLADTVRAMPKGLDTLIGRQGVRLSGGQRQRLAIARLVLSEPQVVILDEATSALDAETEARVHAALADFLEGRTTLIIAHRLSAVKQADRALVFENGQIVEEGAHEQLIRRDGLYARLYGALQH